MVPLGFRFREHIFEEPELVPARFCAESAPNPNPRLAADSPPPYPHSGASVRPPPPGAHSPRRRRHNPQVLGNPALGDESFDLERDCWRGRRQKPARGAVFLRVLRRVAPPERGTDPGCRRVLMALRCETWLDGYELALAQRAVKAKHTPHAWETFAMVHTAGAVHGGMVRSGGCAAPAAPLRRGCERAGGSPRGQVLDEHITGIYIPHSDINAARKRYRSPPQSSAAEPEKAKATAEQMYPIV